MKTQQRKFVVEIKGKRRSAAAPNSFWGDTDLAALSRAVKADAPHLFGEDSQPVPDTTQAMNATSGPDGEGGVEAPAVVNDSPEPRSLEGDQCALPDQAQSFPGTTDWADEKTARQREPRLLIVSKSRRHRPLRAANQRSDTGDFSNQMLQSLIEENERLLAALRAKLQHENERLSRMLARFDDGQRSSL